jgi:hypothetical protein
MYSVAGRSQATTSEVTANWEDLLRAMANCKVPELAKALELLVITIPEVFNASPTPVSSH